MYEVSSALKLTQQVLAPSQLLPKPKHETPHVTWAANVS